MNQRHLINIINKAVEEALENQIPPEKPYCTRNEVAEMLRITLPTLDKLTREGNLIAYKIGVRVLYPYKEIVEYLKKQPHGLD